MRCSQRCRAGQQNAPTLVAVSAPLRTDGLCPDSPAGVRGGEVSGWSAGVRVREARGVSSACCLKAWEFLPKPVRDLARFGVDASVGAVRRHASDFGDGAVHRRGRDWNDVEDASSARGRARRMRRSGQWVRGGARGCRRNDGGSNAGAPARSSQTAKGTTIAPSERVGGIGVPFLCLRPTPPRNFLIPYPRYVDSIVRVCNPNRVYTALRPRAALPPSRPSQRRPDSRARGHGIRMSSEGNAAYCYRGRGPSSPHRDFRFAHCPLPRLSS